MSEGLKHPRDKAIEAANEITNLLRRNCQRIEIAGSLRREKPEVGDIEICAIPYMEKDLFGNEYYSASVVSDILFRSGFEMDKDGENYNKFFFVRYQISVDLFLTTPEQWGIIFMLRTGSADFSRMMVTSRQKGGYMPSHFKVEGGRVWNGKDVLETPEEIHVFKAWNMEFIMPKDRTI